MSALLQPQLSQSAHQPLAEPAALRVISHLASAAGDLDSGLEGLAGSALRVPGLHKIQITPTVAFPHLATLEW